MTNLNNVTLASVACTKIDQTVLALRQSMKNISFHEAILLTHKEIDLSKYNIKVIKIKKLDYKAYNKFILFELKNYIKSDFCLLVQNDGFVIHPNQWHNKFYKYDYIGAPWPKNLHFLEDGTNIRVGNGGFSFRSKKLLETPSKLQLKFTDKGTGYWHEDGFLSVYYRKELEKSGIKYAPVEVAAQFSTELIVEETAQKSFGFHKYKKNIPPVIRVKHLFKIT